MELYATGLNAWGQLNFDKFENSEPGDLSHFTRILSDDKINAVYPHLSYTLGKRIDRIKPTSSIPQTDIPAKFMSRPAPSPPDWYPQTIRL